MRCNGHEGRHRNGLAFWAIVCLWSVSSFLCAQNRNVTLKYTGTPVKEVFKSIKDQTGLSVIYHTEDINPEKAVTVNVTDQPVADAMKEILQKAGSSLSYVIQDNYIVLTKGAPSPSAQMPVSGKPQKRSVSGTVTDPSGEPLIGVTVIVEGNASIGNVTDLDGNYTLNDVPSDASLQFSYVGMKTQVVPVNGQTVIHVKMASDTELLDEVVVTALGIKRSEKALSYNVQKVDQEALTKVKDANFVNSLSGKVAGVQITRSASGIGGATRVIMRGTKSIVGNNNVLYVVDGMPIGNESRGGTGGEFGSPVGGEGISDFNSEDIESISVLTGPSAAALYGAAAANGVILINTKKGAEGAIKVNFSSNTEMLTPSYGPEFQNSYGTEPNTYRSWGPKLETPSTFDPMSFFNKGFSTINSLSLSGGTKLNQTWVSVASTHSQGIIPNNEYYRYNFSARNTSSHLDERLHLDLGASYVLQGDQNMLAEGRYFNPLPALYLFPRGDDFNNVKIWERYDPQRRISTQYWPYGDQGYDLENPYWIVNREMFLSNKHRYMFHARAQYDILDWMNIAGRVRIDNTYTAIQKKLYATTRPLFTGDKDLENAKGQYARSENRYKQTYADVMLNINKSWENDLSLTANIGSSFEDHYSTGVSVGGRLKTIPNFFSTANVDPDVTGGGGESYRRTRNIALFASAELGWKSMLYLSATGRSDWASQLVSNGKTPAIFYPSVGVSGILTEMMAMPEFISYLKLRTSFTEVGSPISQVGITPGTITYDMSQGIANPISTYPYPDFRPERTRSWEFGLNSRFFDGKISLDATLYQSNTYNQTFISGMSPSSGYSGFYVQAGDVRNRGIEMALGFDNKWKSFRYHSNLTYTRNINKIVKMVRDYPNPIDGTTINISYLETPAYLREGDSMNDVYVQGILLKGRDGKLIPEGEGFKIDKSQRLKVGNSAPDFTMGWNNGLQWKGFSFNFLISARFGGVVSDGTQALLDGFGVSKVTADARDAGGVVIDGETYDAKRYYTTVGLNRLGAYYLYDATNIKLQELSFGYGLPKKWLGNILSNVDITVTGRNLLTFYRRAPFDTDISASTGTYASGGFFMPPALRSVGFSVKLGL